MKLSTVFAFGASLALVGCDSQVDPGYRGEPLATVHGSVVAQSQAPSEGDAVLVWQNPAGSPDLSIGVSAPVTGSFPASFTLTIYEPPPAETIISSPSDTGDDRVAVGIVTMLKKGTDLSSLDDEGVLLGMSEDHVVVYIENELEQGGRWEKKLGGRPSVGFHLMTVVRKTQAEKDAVYACQESQSNELTECYTACETQADTDACYAACDADQPATDCGSTFDTFEPAQGGFETSITVKTPASQYINWY